MRTLSSVHCVFLASLVAGCSFSFGKDKIDTEKVETLIKTTLETKLADVVPGQPITVACPEETIKLATGATFLCDVKAGTHALVATITQQDAKGTVGWEITEGIVELTLKSGTENMLSRYVSNTMKLPDVVFACPDAIKVKTGGTFFCSALVDRAELKAEVTQQDELGNVSYTLVGGVVVSKTLSIIIEAELGAKGLKVKVDCGTPMRLSKPGDTFTCSAADAKGQTGVIDVTINDGNGDVNWKPRPDAK